MTNTRYDLIESDFHRYVQTHREIGYGRMMQMISEIWHAEHGDAAHLANETYSGLAKKKRRCKREGHDWSAGTEYFWCDRCGANKRKKR